MNGGDLATIESVTPAGRAALDQHRNEDAKRASYRQGWEDAVTTLESEDNYTQAGLSDEKWKQVVNHLACAVRSAGGWQV
jgi:hypothetical protein